MSAKSLPLNKKTRISEHLDNIELAEASVLKRNYPRSIHPEIQVTEEIQARRQGKYQAKDKFWYCKDELSGLV